MLPLLKKLSGIIFPISCLLCDFPCDNQHAICTHCNKTLPHYTINPNDNIFALFHYETPISELIWKLKFHGDLSIAHLFSTVWIDFIKQQHTFTLPDLIIPVPLHFSRLKQRGFNQALEIAKPIGKYFHIPVDTKSCVRIKDTRPQSSLPAQKRKNNVKNAFGLSYSITAKHVAILDDVITTGNTVSEITQLLQKTGVETIDVWCCARATLH